MTFLLISIYVYDIGGVMTSMPTSSVFRSWVQTRFGKTQILKYYKISIVLLLSKHH